MKLKLIQFFCFIKIFIFLVVPQTTFSQPNVGYRVPEIPQVVYFNTGSSKVTPEMTSSLNDVALIIQSNRGSIARVRIKGYTDAKGNETANLKLSRKRAAAVKNYLVSKGVPSGILLVEGFSEDRPTATDETQSGRAQNRRVEFEAE